MKVTDDEVVEAPTTRMLSLYVCGRCSFTAKVEQTWVFERVLHDCWL